MCIRQKWKDDIHVINFRKQSTKFGKLPAEILWNIFSYTDYITLCMMQRVSSWCKLVVNNCPQWKVCALTVLINNVGALHKTIEG